MLTAKRVGIIVLLLVVNGAGLVVTFIGPWPAYGARDIAEQPYYRQAQAAIDARAAELSEHAEGRFHAGWAKADMTPPIGTPLAGYGDRAGAPSTGVHDPLFVRALAVSDERHQAVILAADMLIVPPNVADAVRERLRVAAGLSEHDLLFNASHTHSGPGGFAPGFVSSLFAGDHDPNVEALLVEAFVDAAHGALDALEPARMAHGQIKFPDAIRNRVRDAAVDPWLHYMVIDTESGARCYMARYSAHSTVLPSRNMSFSGDYPGFLERALEERTGGFAMFLAGAMGSMSPRTPEGADHFERARLLGYQLAEQINAQWMEAEFSERVPVASVGIPLELPPWQLRVHPRWRLSPAVFHLAGLAEPGWLHGLRLGDAFLFATPADFSGEIAVDLFDWAAERGWSLWTLSFNGAYVGYISPDRYYKEASPSGREAYEMYVMSWIGPNQEALFTGLGQHMASTLMDREAL